MAPFTPSIIVEAAFGNAPMDGVKTWVDLTSAYKAADINITRGRPTEFDRFKPATCSLRLLDATRDLDPTNLSGTYVETVTTSDYAVADVAGVSTEVGTDLGTDEATTLPSGIVAGDLLLAWVAVDLAGAGTGVSLGTGSAVWTELFDMAVGTSCRLACYARIATLSDALVVTGAAQDYVIAIHRVVRHGCTTTADIVVGAGATGTGGGTQPNAPNLAPGSSAKWLWLAGAAGDLTTGEALFIPTTANMTSVVTTKSANSTSSVGLAVGQAEAEASSFDPDAWTTQPGGGAPWVANTIAVPPATSSRDRTQITPDVPIRVSAVLPDRVTVFDDPCTGPGLHSDWRVVSGALDALSGTLVVPATGLVLDGPAFNFDGDSTFQFGTVADGTSPNFDVRIVLSNGGYVGWNLTGSTLTYAVNDGGSTADDTVSWNDTNHRYLRIRIDDDDVVWERSSDGSAWTTIDTYTRGADFASTVDWSFGKLYVRSTGATCTLDDFKVEVSRFTRFTGTIDSWDYQPLGGNQGALVAAQATDAFKQLAHTQPPQAWKTAVEALAPVAWYPLGERDGQTAYDASGNGYDGLIPECVKKGEDPVAPTLGNGSVRMVHSYPPYFNGIALPDALRRTSYPYTINLWMRAAKEFPRDVTTYATGNSLPGMLFAQGPDGNNMWFEIYVLAGQTTTSGDFTTADNWRIGLDWFTSRSSGRRLYFRSPLGDVLPHMITMVVTTEESALCYVDGVVQEILFYLEADFASSLDAVPGMWIGPPAFIADESAPFNTAFWGLEGFIDEVTVHDEALTGDEIVGLYQAAARVGGGDSTGARVHRVLDLIGWPDELRLVDTGEITLAPDYLFGTDALAYLQRVAESEGGRLFIGPHGEVVFHDAGRVDTRATDPVVFSDTGDPGELNILGDGFRVTHDDRLLFTAAVVSREGGTTQTYQNDDAVDRYGLREWSGSASMARLDVEALMRAAAIVERYKEPAPRLERFTVAPEKRPDDWPLMLGLRLGDTIQATFTPLATGDTYSEYLDVAEISETVSGGAWTFTLHGTPQDPGIGNFFEWDASADLGWDYGEFR
ncbi:MAG: hypothetical protein AB7H92_14055 [Microbacteriaceae bacterium]